jgi:hypothetical protein
MSYPRSCENHAARRRHKGATKQSICHGQPQAAGAAANCSRRGGLDKTHRAYAPVFSGAAIRSLCRLYVPARLPSLDLTGDAPNPSSPDKRRRTMLDIIFIVLGFGGILAMAAYAALCGRI